MPTAGQRRKPNAAASPRAAESADAGHALLDQDSPLPLWAQIAQILRLRIAQHGANLTGLTDQALAAEFGVSPLTVRQALQELVHSGLITRHRGRGTFVVSMPAHGSVDYLDTAMSEWRVQGAGVRIEILERSRTAASIPTAAALQVKPGQMVGYLHRLRHADGHPVGVDYRYIVAEIDERLDDKDVEHETMWEVLENKLGVLDIRANVTISAVGANAEDAALLRIAPGAPVLNRGFHLVTAAGRPLLVGHSVYHPDRFIHATTVRRPRS